MERIAELHRRALASVRSLCNNTGHHLESALRSIRVSSVVSDVQRLLDCAEGEAVDPDTQRRAHEAAADVLWRLSSCYEQNGWDWSELGPIARVSTRYLQ